MTKENQKLNESTRAGFTLVEVVVAMVILSVVLVGLAAQTLHTATFTLMAQGADQRESLLTQQANLLAAVPYANLGTYAGCTTVTTAPFPHTRCVTLTALAGNVNRVTIVVTPTLANRWAPDTVIIDRGTMPNNPMNTP
jgi:prepilin-type N-terminal cleavage/methylation domain-containing protein